jgi:hypothetical protein
VAEKSVWTWFLDESAEFPQKEMNFKQADADWSRK